MITSPFDGVAAEYDATRGGEPRGDRYAAELLPLLRPTQGLPVLEVGVGTGVVSLGIRRRGVPIVGLDFSAGMLGQAAPRLGPSLVRGDACQLPVRGESLLNVISVWMVQAVPQPAAMFEEAYRVLAPGGRFVVCPTNRPMLKDPIGVVIARLFKAVSEVHQEVGAQVETASDDLPDVTRWAEAAGFQVRVERLEDQEWATSPAQEIEAIRARKWAALVGLDAATYDALAAPAIAALESMPQGPRTRKATAQAVLCDKPA